MALELGWHRENRIIKGQFVGDLSVEDLIALGKTAQEYVEQGVAPVHFVVDVTKMGKFPQNVVVLRNSLSYLKNPKMGWNVIVGTPAIVAAFAQIIARVTGVSYKNVATMDAAMEFLERVDATLVEE